MVDIKNSLVVPEGHSEVQEAEEQGGQLTPVIQEGHCPGSNIFP